MPADRNSLHALRNMLEETELLISTTDPLPENRTPAALDLLKSCTTLIDDLLKQAPKAAAVLGHKGGGATKAHHGRSRSGDDLHVPYRAPKPHDLNADAAAYPPHERVQQEVGEPVGGILPAFRLLQFLPHPQKPSRDACHGSWFDHHVWDITELLA